MAHFAEIDDNNIVIRVLVVSNDQESRGQDFLANDLGLGGRWIQTSYNGNFRKNYAQIGFIYDKDIDAFIPPKPYQSWILNKETGQWEAPSLLPNDGKNYVWQEETNSWQQGQ